MKRTFLLSVALSALCTSTHSAPVSDFSGFVIGGSAGYGTVLTGFSLNQNNFLTNFDDLGEKGALLGVHVGYGKQFRDKMFVGIEFFDNLSKIKGIEASFSTNPLANVSETNKKRDEFGFAIRPGMVFGNALLYAKAGISSARFEVMTTASPLNPFSIVNYSKQLTGFVPGLGVEFLATNHILIGVEMTHSMYRQSTFTGSFGADKYILSSKPSSTEGQLRISYLG